MQKCKISKFLFDPVQTRSGRPQIKKNHQDKKFLGFFFWGGGQFYAKKAKSKNIPPIFGSP